MTFRRVFWMLRHSDTP